MQRFMAKIEPRMLALTLGGGLVLVLLSAYAQLFKKEVAEFARLQRVHSESVRDVATEQDLVGDHKIQMLEKQIQTFETQLFGKKLDLPPSQMVSHIIGQLDRLSVRHGVELIAVRPGDGGEILSFSEVPFDVEVRGEYFDLYAWLRDAEAELRPMVVKQFRLVPHAEESDLLMNLRVVSYRSDSPA